MSFLLRLLKSNQTPPNNHSLLPKRFALLPLIWPKIFALLPLFHPISVFLIAILISLWKLDGETMWSFVFFSSVGNLFYVILHTCCPILISLSETRCHLWNLNFKHPAFASPLPSLWHLSLDFSNCFSHWKCWFTSSETLPLITLTLLPEIFISYQPHKYTLIWQIPKSLTLFSLLVILHWLDPVLVWAHWIAFFFTCFWSSV